MVNRTVPRSRSRCPRAAWSLVWWWPGQWDGSQTFPALGLARDWLPPLGNLDPATLSWRWRWLNGTDTNHSGHGPPLSLSNGEWSPVNSLDRCSHGESIPVDLEAKLCLVCMYHGYATTSSLTLSLVDRHNTQQCFQLLFYWTIIIIYFKKNQLIRFTFENL